MSPANNAMIGFVFWEHTLSVTWADFGKTNIWGKWIQFVCRKHLSTKLQGALKLSEIAAVEQWRNKKNCELFLFILIRHCEKNKIKYVATTKAPSVPWCKTQPELFSLPVTSRPSLHPLHKDTYLSFRLTLPGCSSALEKETKRI